ncbi:MAG: hypothetical protein ABIU95_03045, partial [Burkholderiales bacterium]
HPSAVPATLQDSLMARLDQLGSAKEVAQMGAVIGREFSHELVAALVPMDEATLREALEQLTRAVIVYPRGAHGSTKPAATFIFKHALVQDAAYASLLRTKRQSAHGRIATILEASSAPRVHVEPELVAHHYTEAHQWLAAAKHWAVAAQHSLDRSANLEALRHATRGLEVLARADAPDASAATARDQIEANLEILRGAAYRALSGFAASDAERSFIRASELCAQLGDVPRLIDARRGLFACYYARGALALAHEQALAVAALGARLNDSGSRMLGHWMLGCVQFWQGEFVAAQDALEHASALYDPNEQRAQTLALQIDPGVNALLHLSWARWVLGYPDEAIRTGEQAIATARRLTQPFALSMALFFAGATRICCGHESAARALVDELTALCAEQALGYMGSCARVLEAQLLIADGKAQAALEQIHLAFTEFKTQEAGVGLPWAMATAAAAYARLGRAQEGLATLAQAAQAATRNGEHHWSAELWRLKGELLLALPAPDENGAQTCFIEARSVARRQGARSLELRAATSLARLWARQGNPEPARRVLTEARAWFPAECDSIDLREAGIALQTL